MERQKLTKVEEIYPLTILSMRYGGMYIANVEIDNGNYFMVDIQISDEYTGYNLEEYHEEKNIFWDWGHGKTIEEAFIDFKKRASNNEFSRYE